MKASDQKSVSMFESPGFRSVIAEALFPRIRGKVLALFMMNPEGHFYFRETVRIIGDSPSSVQRELKSLTAAGILKMEPIGIQKFYRVNGESPVYEELRSIARKTFGAADALKEVLRAHAGKIQLAWIDGSFASGKDHGRADIDLTIIGTLWIGDLASIVEPVEGSLGRSITPILFAKEDFLKKCEGDRDFAKSVADSDKMFIVGDDDEFRGLFRM